MTAKASRLSATRCSRPDLVRPAGRSPNVSGDFLEPQPADFGAARRGQDQQLHHEAADAAVGHEE